MKTMPKWFWIYGVPYCPGCVGGKSKTLSGGGSGGSCLSRHERAKAMREVPPTGARCHCCGTAAHGMTRTTIDRITNAETVTRKQIEALQTEAGAAGDYQMADICERALDGCPIALQAVADAIAAAAAMIDA